MSENVIPDDSIVEEMVNLDHELDDDDAEIDFAEGLT